MTLLDEPPVVTASPVERPIVARSTPSVWRLALRLARRETRRRPGRTVLAALLIAVPVSAMTIGSAFARSESGSWPAQFERRYGDADIAVDPSMFGFVTSIEDGDGGGTDGGADGGADIGGGAVQLPPGTETSGHLWVNTTVELSNAASPFTYATVTDIDLGGRNGGAPIEVVEGREPRNGEVLLPAGLADALRVTVGDDVTFERPSGTWTVSGFSRVRDTYYLDAIVIPGFDPARVAPEYEQRVTLYDLPADTSFADTQRLAAELGGVTSGVDPYGEPSSTGGTTRGMAWGWVAGSLALVAVGIIVAAAFATSARRQLVTIGQLASNGATESVIRRTLALQGTWTGLIGASVGIAAGLASLPLLEPVIARHILQHDVAPLRISVLDLAIIAITATVAGTIAASVPARSASRTPIMSALAGRRPLGTLPRWLVPTGMALLAGGLGLVAAASLGINGSAGGRSDDVWALLIVLGVVGVVFGMCCATPLVVERIGPLGRRAPLSWRLALRSLGRSRTRSSAVAAAIAVAVGGAVAAGAIVETTIHQDTFNTPLVPSDIVVLDVFRFDPLGGPVDESDPIIDAPALPAAPVSADLRAQLLEIVPDATIVPVRFATIDPVPFDTRSGNAVWPNAEGPRIADQALLDAIGLSSDDLDLLEETGSLQPMSSWQLADRDEGGLWFGQYEGPAGVIDFTPTVGTDPFRYDFGGWGLPLATEEFARELGFDIVERGAIVQAPRALTVEQRDDLANLQSSLTGPFLDAFVEPGDPPRSPTVGTPVDGEQWNLVFDEPRYRTVDEGDVWTARLVVVGLALVFSLLVVAIGLSLAAAEGREERNTLDVVGASPASMRRQSAARATVMATSGILLGIPTGLLPTWVLYSVLNSNQQISSEPLRFPWLIVAGLLVAVPALVAGVAWFGSGVAGRFRRTSPTRRD